MISTSLLTHLLFHCRCPFQRIVPKLRNHLSTKIWRRRDHNSENIDNLPSSLFTDLRHRFRLRLSLEMACAVGFNPLLRQLAPNLSRHFFQGCRRQCPRRQLHNNLHRSPTQSFESLKNTPFLQAFRSQSTTVQSGALSSIADLGRARAGQIAGMASLSGKSPAEKGGYFPKITRSTVAWWLYGSAASVFGIVVFGGLTRLTESGLSITEWRPVTGSLPPLNAAQWESEYALYKASPEFKKLNPNMDIGEFKKIYWMEWPNRGAGKKENA